MITPAIDWQELFLNLGAFGLVAWIVVHLYKVVFPTLTKAFSEAQEKMRAIFADEQRQTRHDFKDALQTIALKLEVQVLEFRTMLDTMHKEHIEEKRKMREEHDNVVIRLAQEACKKTILESDAEHKK